MRSISTFIIKQLQVLHIESRNQSESLISVIEYVSSSALSLQSLVIASDSRSRFDQNKIMNHNLVSLISKCTHLRCINLQCQGDLTDIVFNSIAELCPQLVEIKFCLQLTSSTVKHMMLMFSKCRLLSHFELGSFTVCDFHDYTSIIILSQGKNIKSVVLNNLKGCLRHFPPLEFFDSFKLFTQISLLNMYAITLIETIVAHNPGLKELRFYNSENRTCRKQLTFRDLLMLSKIPVLRLCDVCHSNYINAVVQPVSYVCQETLRTMSLDYYWSHIYEKLDWRTYSPPEHSDEFSTFENEWFASEDKFIYQLASIYQSKSSSKDIKVIARFIMTELKLA
jgi:hypothetical protein